MGIRWFPLRRVRIAILAPIAAVTASGLFLLLWSPARGGDEPGNSLAAPSDTRRTIDPARIEGPAACVDCHRQEVARWNENWKDSGHGWKGYRYLLEDAAADFAKELNTTPKDPRCLKCHATPNLDAQGRASSIMGVTCEACHNPAGGEDGWLNPHGVYGPPGTGRAQETRKHFEYRAKVCRGADQLRSSDLHLLVQRCYECHLVDDAELVKAGHPEAGEQFDNLLEGFTHEMIKHNFHLDQQNNADVATLWTHTRWGSERTPESRKRMIFVVGELVKVEMLLQSLASQQGPEEFLDLLEISKSTEEALSTVDTPSLRRLRDELKKTGKAFRTDEEDEADEVADEDLFENALEAILDAPETSDGELSPAQVLALRNLTNAIRTVAIEVSSGDGTELKNLDLEDL